MQRKKQRPLNQNNEQSVVKIISKSLPRNKVYSVDDLILQANNKAKKQAYKAAARLFNEVSVPKNKTKSKGYFGANP